MVFVAMESDELLTRTAQYQIQYQPSRAHRRATVIIRHERQGSSVARIQARTLQAYSYGGDHDDDDDDDDEEDYRTAQIPPEFTASRPPFNITTECSDDEADLDESDLGELDYSGIISAGTRGTRYSDMMPPGRRTPYHIGALPFENDSSDDGADVWGPPSRNEWPTLDEVTAIRRHYPASSSRPRGSDRSGRGGGMTLEEAREASQIATQEAVRAVGGQLMAPLAHFFIEKDKNRCTIRFDPPVSGRFILLKMWSPHHDVHDGPKNIDIQAVIAKGFAGPRYCPAVELA